VRAEQGRPVRVVADRRGMSGGAVTQCAGPWRTSGGWHLQFENVRFEDLKDRDHDLLKSSNCKPSHSQMIQVWDRDEWDVTLSDGATYRVFRDRGTNAWFLEGIVD